MSTFEQKKNRKMISKLYADMPENSHVSNQDNFDVEAVDEYHVNLKKKGAE